MKGKVLFSISAAAVLLLSACSPSGQEAAGDASPTTEEAGSITFSHPSIENLQIDFEARPQKLVMDCYSYSSLHDYGLEPAAIFGFDCDNPVIMGDADVSGIPRIGQNGEIDMEKLAEIRPDAVIGNGDADGWSWFDDDVNAQLTRVAPFIPLPATGDIDTKIADTREIADFLGADVTADSIVRADADLESAKREFRDAVSGRDLNFLLASPTKEILYTGVGFAQADLLAELGATIVGAEAPATGNPWGQVAWEDASTYPADVILVEGYDPENPFSAELWDDLPAVKARQLSGWYSKGALTSRNYADWLGGLAERARGYTKVS